MSFKINPCITCGSPVEVALSAGNPLLPDDFSIVCPENKCHWSDNFEICASSDGNQTIEKWNNLPRNSRKRLSEPAPGPWKVRPNNCIVSSHGEALFSLMSNYTPQDKATAILAATAPRLLNVCDDTEEDLGALYVDLATVEALPEEYLQRIGDMLDRLYVVTDEARGLDYSRYLTSAQIEKRKEKNHD